MAEFRLRAGRTPSIKWLEPRSLVPKDTKVSPGSGAGCHVKGFASRSRANPSESNVVEAPGHAEERYRATAIGPAGDPVCIMRG